MIWGYTSINWVFFLVLKNKFSSFLFFLIFFVVIIKWEKLGLVHAHDTNLAVFGPYSQSSLPRPQA